VPKTPQATTAIVRDVPAVYDQCIRSDAGASIDVALAREQHQHYCAALRAAGLSVMRIEADDRFPDCCFVEDPALVVDDLALVLNVGVASRRGESEAVRQVLSAEKRVVEIGSPATLEGGDVLRIGDRLYVGLTERSNRKGIEALRSLLDGERYEVIPVELDNALHLKSACAYLGSNWVVCSPGHFDESVFADYDRIDVPAADAYSVNCLALNDIVLVAEGYPGTKMKIEGAGFKTVEVPVSEFRKGDGGLSCLSLRF
jgi:dimethylargininase